MYEGLFKTNKVMMGNSTYQDWMKSDSKEGLAKIVVNDKATIQRLADSNRQHEKTNRDLVLQETANRVNLKQVRESSQEIIHKLDKEIRKQRKIIKEQLETLQLKNQKNNI